MTRTRFGPDKKKREDWLEGWLDFGFYLLGGVVGVCVMALLAHLRGGCLS